MRKINPNKTTLIGVHGPLESGKDTVAQVVVEMFPNLYRQYAFAWPIKKACQIIFGFTEDDMNDRVMKERVHPFWGVTPRKTMQLLGTEYGRNMIREDIWVLRAQSEIQKNAEQGFGTIISDVRFDNEAQVIRSRNGVIIHITRPELDTSVDKYQHASEGGIQKLDDDFLINNNGSLLEFRQKIIDLFGE
jgi:Deoxynucleotide monophosphate kinase